jgi:hypothetical protein
VDLERYRDNLDHLARLNKRKKKEPTRQPRWNNRLYCLVWADNDLFKVGLGSGEKARDSSALKSIKRYFDFDRVTPGKFDEWRADLPALDSRAWGDGQRFEMVFATALKRRLNAGAAGAVGLEWFFRRDLQLVQWEEELKAATATALHFSGLEQPTVDWVKQPSPLASAPHRGAGGSSQRDAWRTTRNKRGGCAMKGCGAPVTDQDVRQDGFLYCSEAHATVDRSVGHPPERLP